MSLVGCGETKKEGFVPEQVTESEVVTDDVKENIEEVIDTENLQKYYDVTKCVGTPRLEVLSTSFFIAEKNPETISLVDDHGAQYKIAFTKELKPNVDYNVILCDNNTPNDLSDDVVAYIFTTPIAE